MWRGRNDNEHTHYGQRKSELAATKYWRSDKYQTVELVQTWIVLVCQLAYRHLTKKLGAWL